jgi:hypothetical protein
MTADL